jgi:hypothetical protein
MGESANLQREEQPQVVPDGNIAPENPVERLMDLPFIKEQPFGRGIEKVMAGLTTAWIK